MRGTRIVGSTAIVLGSFLASVPAWAVNCDGCGGGGPAAPAPVVGLGIGAWAVMGLGYRALKRRIGR